MSGLLAILLEYFAVGGLVVAAATDVRTRIIPNELVVWVVSMGLASRLITDGWACWISLLLASAVFLMLGLAVSHSVIGGADSKMIAATTLLVEPAGIPRLLAAIALSGGVLAMTGLAARAIRVRPNRQSGRANDRPIQPGLFGCEATGIEDGQSMPYGVAILIGVAFVVLFPKGL